MIPITPPRSQKKFEAGNEEDVESQMIREVQRHGHGRVRRILLVKGVKDISSQNGNNECDADSTPECGLFF